MFRLFHSYDHHYHDLIFSKHYEFTIRPGSRRIFELRIESWHLLKNAKKWVVQNWSKSMRLFSGPIRRLTTMKIIDKINFPIPTGASCYNVLRISAINRKNELFPANCLRRFLLRGKLPNCSHYQLGNVFRMEELCHKTPLI